MKANYFKNITYTDKTETPLLWHDFNRFIRVPFGIMQMFVEITDSYRYNAKGMLFVNAPLIFALLVFEIDQAKWKKSAYYAIMFSSVVLTMINMLIIVITNGEALTILGYITVCAFELYYYSKRKLLFDGVSMKEAKTIKNDLISRNTNENDERAVFLENKKNDYIVLRNRLREIKAPGFEDLVAKVKQGRELTDYENRVFETRKLMNVLYDSVDEEKPFGPEYDEVKVLIDKLEDDLKSQ